LSGVALQLVVLAIADRHVSTLCRSTTTAPVKIDAIGIRARTVSMQVATSEASPDLEQQPAAFWQ
jgi:hypothetical protein